MKLIQGDCLEVMKALPDNSVDACVTDPPYGLKFMGKKWDYDVPTVEQWEEVYRVMKPGAFLLSFGGTRTYHRMVVNIEDAGFEIRDQIQWLYGSGFPKSLDVGKAIDKIAEENTGAIRAKRELGNWLKTMRGDRPQKAISKHFPSKTGGLTGCVANWELGFNLPTWEIWEKLKTILSLDDRFDYLIKGRPTNHIEAEREITGKDKNWGERGAVPLTGYKEFNITTPATPEAIQWNGWGTALKPANEPICLARKPLSEKTVAANVLKWGTGGLNIDGCRVEGGSDYQDSARANDHRAGGATSFINNNLKAGFVPSQGRFPANVIHDGSDEVVGLFPNTVSKWGHSNNKGNKLESNINYVGTIRNSDGNEFRGDSGLAARFFYCAKASKAERGEGNNHPTVKPLKLMCYLCRLVTPPGGTVLDCYVGSGTTGVAAQIEGFDFIGIDKDIRIATRRIEDTDPLFQAVRL